MPWIQLHGKGTWKCVGFLRELTILSFALQISLLLCVSPPQRCPPCHARLAIVQVVEFLHYNRVEGCTTAAMDNAASGGHLEILKFLAANRNEGCTIYAMILAAWHGHLRVVEWLHNNRNEVSGQL